MIKIEKLTKVYASGQKAIDELDLSIQPGEIAGLLGPNGAGKTSTIRVMSTLSGFDSGKVHIAGYDIDKDPAKIRRAIGYVGQQTGVDNFLSGRENLKLMGHLYRMKPAEIQTRITELSQYFGLEPHLDQVVASYSGGMRRKLDIATALMHRPQMLFLDEPTLGLDIKSRKNMWSLITQLNREWKLTILLTTHYLEEADQLAHRVAIINRGKIRVIDTPENLKNTIHGDAVTLFFNPMVFNQASPQATSFEKTLRQQPYFRDLLWAQEKLHLYLTDSGQHITQVMTLAHQHQLELNNLSLSKPTLDDVFLKYTGSSLGQTEEPQDEWWKQWAGKDGGSGQWKKWAGHQESQADTETKKQPEWQQTPAAPTPPSQEATGQKEGDSSQQQWPQQEQWGNSQQWSNHTDGQTKVAAEKTSGTTDENNTQWKAEPKDWK